MKLLSKVLSLLIRAKDFLLKLQHMNINNCTLITKHLKELVLYFLIVDVCTKVILYLTGDVQNKFLFQQSQLRLTVDIIQTDSSVFCNVVFQIINFRSQFLNNSTCFFDLGLLTASILYRTSLNLLIFKNPKIYFFFSELI